MNTEETKAGSQYVRPVFTLRLVCEAAGLTSSVTLPDDVAAWVLAAAIEGRWEPAQLCGSIITTVSREDRLAHGQEPSVLQ